MTKERLEHSINVRVTEEMFQELLKRATEEHYSTNVSAFVRAVIEKYCASSEDA